MKKNIYLSLILLFCITFCMASCSNNMDSTPGSKDDPNYPNGSSIIHPYFESTNRGVYLRWNDVSDQSYNLFYTIEYIVSTVFYDTDTDIFTIYKDSIQKTTTSLPTYDFTSILRDISLFVYFRVKVSTFEFKTPNIACFTYDVSKTHFTTCPIPSNLQVSNGILTWDKVEGVKTYRLCIKGFKEDLSSKTVYMNLNQTSFDLNSIETKLYKKLEISISSLGNGNSEDLTGYFHNSNYSNIIEIDV